MPHSELTQCGFSCLPDLGNVFDYFLLFNHNVLELSSESLKFRNKPSGHHPLSSGEIDNGRNAKYTA